MTDDVDIVLSCDHVGGCKVVRTEVFHTGRTVPSLLKLLSA
jgi:hypothetical protein